MSVFDKLKILEKEEGYVALATVDSKNYQKTNIEMIKYFVNIKNIPGVYVTLNKPYDVIKSLLIKDKVNIDIIIFIDGVTKTAGGETERIKDCLFLGNPENLSDISMAMDQAVRAIGGNKRFLFFDSIDTLLIYNDAKTVARFIHFLAGKMRVWKVEGIIVSLSQKSNQELIEELSQFCDIRLEF